MADSLAPRFGATFGGVKVLLPEGIAAEYLPGQPVWPLPGAPRRMLGLAQLRGAPVPVFDASPAGPQELPVIGRRALLVLLVGSDPAALAVEAPPREVGAVASPAAAGVPRPACAFQEALAGPAVDARGELWWQLDAARLFEALGR